MKRLRATAEQIERVLDEEGIIDPALRRRIRRHLEKGRPGLYGLNVPGYRVRHEVPTGRKRRGSP